MFRSEKPKFANFQINYAKRTDVCEVLERETSALYLLAFLLTANHEAAEQCFVETVNAVFKERAVFKGWVRSWIKRSLIKNAIRIVSPASARHRANQDSWREMQLATGRDSQLHAVTRLDPLERFVFVLSILESHSIWDCALLLGCSMNQVTQARMRALRRLPDLYVQFASFEAPPSRPLEITA